jgi:hypothetical protein
MTQQSSDALESIVYSLCQAINTPRSLSVWLCFKYNQAALLELPPADIATNDTSSFQLQYFLSMYLKKYKGLKAGVDTRRVALEKWKLSEARCLETNARFRGLMHRPTTGRVEAALFRAQRKIASVLGILHMPLVLSGCKWGPGATFDLRREVATPDNKISQAISVTSTALPYLRAVVESDPHWAYCFLGEIPEGRFSLLPSSNPYKVVRGSRFLTVPKSAKTDRCIAAEPTGNSFLQQGVHSFIRRRLKRFGVDLDDQSINQNYARDAYHSGLSTLDLSAASDSISRELVYFLLPIDWALFLDALRSPETLVDGEWIRTEKFASMGNAFCFELESLIFWALASSVDETSSKDAIVSVYGDDIIVSRHLYDPLVSLLEFCGFGVNVDKSFKEGNFFESCGKHFHRAIDVTPVFQTEILNHPSEIIRAHNRLVRLESRLLNRLISFKGAEKLLSNRYPLRPFPRVPFGVSEDGGFLRPLSDFLLDKNHGFRCHVLDYVPRYILTREHAVYAYKLRRFSQQNPTHEGYAGNITKGRWRTKVRWVPEHSVGGFSSN